MTSVNYPKDKVRALQRALYTAAKGNPQRRFPLRGWGNYFRWGNSSRKFVQVDSYVQERLALFDSKKRGRSGRGWGERHNAAWLQSLGVYRLSGTVRYGSPAKAAV